MKTKIETKHQRIKRKRNEYYFAIVRTVCSVLGVLAMLLLQSLILVNHARPSEPEQVIDNFNQEDKARLGTFKSNSVVYGLMKQAALDNPGQDICNQDICINSEEF